jgi:hypothetical protein
MAMPRTLSPMAFCGTQALQSGLDEKMQRMSMLETENSSLTAANARLQADLAAKDAQLRGAAALVGEQREKLSSQERQVADLTGVVEAQRSQLRSSTLAGIQPEALADRLLMLVSRLASGGDQLGAGSVTACALLPQVKDAFAEVSAREVPPRVALSPEVVAALSRSLNSCCRELLHATKALQAPVAAASAIAVSVC